MQLLSEESLSFSRDKDILTIKLNTNIEDPTIAFSDGGEEWITFIKRAEFGEKVSLQFEVAANETYKNRSSRITLSSPLVDNEVIVDVLQNRLMLLLQINSLSYMIYPLGLFLLKLNIMSRMKFL